VQVGTIHGFQHLEMRVNIYGILRLKSCVTFHIGLAKTKEDIKFFILRMRYEVNKNQQQYRDALNYFFHHSMFKAFTV
jgi:hypothetical protein